MGRRRLRTLSPNVAWERAQSTPIRLLLGALASASGDRNWSYKLRFGLFEIGDGDMDLIAKAMGAAEFHGPTATSTVAARSPCTRGPQEPS
jgi:hypothetical protein